MDKFKRSEKPKPITPSDRDYHILRLLSVHRVLNSEHIARFLNLNDSSYIWERLKSLFDHQYLDRIKNYHNDFSETGSDKIIYDLADKGAEELNRAGDNVSVRGRSKNNNRPKVGSLRHNLLTLDFLTSLLALEEKNTRILFSDDILIGFGFSVRLTSPQKFGPPIMLGIPAGDLNNETSQREQNI